MRCRQTKLRVVLVGPPKPPSPVPEGVEEPASPATVAHRDVPRAPAGTAAASLRDQLGAAQEDKAEIRKRLEHLQVDRSAAGGGTRGGALRQVSRGMGGAQSW
jgi:hypothetical protein